MLLKDEINNVVKKFDKHPVLVMSGESWHEGIIGIVASRIKDLHNKPTILISLKDGVGKGSARSILGFDIGSEIIKGVQSKFSKKGEVTKWPVDLLLNKKIFQYLGRL